MYIGKTGLHGHDGEGPAIRGIESVCQCLLSEMHITQPSTAAVGKVMTERNADLLFNDELDSGPCDGLLQVELKIN